MRSRALHACEIAASTTASSLRAWRGTLVRRRVSPLPQPLQLFDIESCPFCRRVREALTELDLDVEIYPCPKRGTRHRPRARELAGRELFPTLHDPNAGVTVVGSGEVLRYLFEELARDSVPIRFRMGLASSGLASVVRFGRGTWAAPSRPASQPLELYSFESSPFSRLVRERLCSFELAYLLHNLGKEQVADIGLPELGLHLRLGRYAPVPGGKREALGERGGRIQVPFLVDPNTGTELYESRDILDYLDRTYAA
jgi:glutathione S-transferase